jgi:hypothetical protein
MELPKRHATSLYGQPVRTRDQGRQIDATRLSSVKVGSIELPSCFNTGIGHVRARLPGEQRQASPGDARSSYYRNS